ncbi:MAG: DUF945 domain-containing protein, partial [Nitrososphaera sp.]|nr:DUF945 domain-containing protein [Nitrososphaera sp.]
VNGNDLVEKYLLLTNSHDGSEVVRVRLTPIRVVCENTLVAALGGAEQEVRIRHTASASDKLKEVHKLLGLTNQLYDQLEQIFNGMSAKKIGNLSLTEYLNGIFPGIDEPAPSRQKNFVKDTILQLVESGRGSEMAKGTLWGAYNAVTEFVDHYRQPSAEPSQRLKSMWFGSGEQIKRKAFRVAVEKLSK